MLPDVNVLLPLGAFVLKGTRGMPSLAEMLEDPIEVPFAAVDVVHKQVTKTTSATNRSRHRQIMISLAAAHVHLKDGTKRGTSLFHE